MHFKDPQPKNSSRGSWKPAVCLFFLAPFIGEFLLGNLPITWLWTMLVLAPMYGGGAVLIRETGRRFGLGWPGMVLLGIAYALVEEAFVTQSLFNPDYLGLRLLDYGYVPWLGIGSWWTVFVIGIHVVWSTMVPIALTESLFPGRGRKPWLGRFGIGLVFLLFVLGCLASWSFSRDQENSFAASTRQLLVSVLVLFLLVWFAFVAGKWVSVWVKATRRGPDNIQVFLVPFLLGSSFMILAYSRFFNRIVLDVGGMLIVLLILSVLLLRWSRTASWGQFHELAVAAGLAGVYIWYGFLQVPSVGETSPLVDAAGNVICSVLVLGLIYVAFRRNRGPRPEGSD